jgi:hypothetical protein
MFKISNHKFLHFKLNYPEKYDDNDRVKLCIGVYKLFITIPLWKTNVVAIDEPRSYGIAVCDDSLLVYYGKGYNLYDLPWQFTIVRWDLLYNNGAIYHRNVWKNEEKVDKHLHWYAVDEKIKDDPKSNLCTKKEVVYVAKDGDVQYCIATLYGEELEWRRKWLKWIPLFNYVSRRCDFTFSREMGERSGSWKGGLTATSCEWKHGETLEAAFKRWYFKWNGN